MLKLSWTGWGWSKIIFDEVGWKKCSCLIYMMNFTMNLNWMKRGWSKIVSGFVGWKKWTYSEFYSNVETTWGCSKNHLRRTKETILDAQNIHIRYGYMINLLISSVWSSHDHECWCHQSRSENKRRHSNGSSIRIGLVARCLFARFKSKHLSPSSFT